jgi:hypothetical protein
VTFPFGQTVTLVKRVKGGPDDFGNDTWTTTMTDVRGAFAPGSSVEQIQGQDIVVTQPTVYLPPGTDATAIDAVQVDGLQYEIDGDPRNWVNPFTGWRAGVEVPLRRATG